MKHQLLQNTIQYLAQVPDREVDKFAAITKTKSFEEGAYFIQKGQIPRKFGFVIKGVFRYLYIDSSGKEYTRGFMPERYFISSYSAMFQQQPSSFFIEAIEPTEILEIDFHRWQQLRSEHQCWDDFLLAILHQMYLQKEKREQEFLLLDAQERYISFQQNFPRLKDRISKRIIASYLGITPESLSRIRKKMEK